MFCLLGFLAGCGTPTQRIVTPTTLPGKIVVRNVMGEARAVIQGTGESVKLQDNLELRQGTVVSTGADAVVELDFSNAIVLTLAAQSELAIEAYTQIPAATVIIPGETTEEPSSSVTRLTLLRGHASGRAPRLNLERGSSFTIRTPAGEQALSATGFSVSAP
jgi:hypothetical protein